MPKKVKMFKKLASLIAEVALQVSSEQDVSIFADVDMAEFLNYLVPILYLNKVKRVNVTYYDKRLFEKFLKNTPDSRLSSYLDNFKMLMQRDSNTNSQRLILVSEDFEYVKQFPMERYNVFRQMLCEMEREEGMRYINNELSYSVVPIPTSDWASNLFKKYVSGNKKFTPSQAESHLWELLYDTCKIDAEHNQIDVYNTHIDQILSIVNRLNEKNVEYLRIVSEKFKTNLVLKLPIVGSWKSGVREDKVTGKRFVKFLPCNQVYSAVSSHACNGIVYASGDVFYNGNKITGAWIKLESGKIVDFGATEGKEHLEEAFNSDSDYSRRLGKIGIVEKVGRKFDRLNTYGNMMWAKNEMNHIVIGNGPCECIECREKHGEVMTKEERISHGLNQSQLKLLFPIDYDDLVVYEREEYSANENVLYENGSWKL